jgi:hypothetical protein
MPNFDGGTYFLSALIPIRQGLVPPRDEQGSAFSHTHALREILALLPSQNSAALPPQAAPFSREPHTHFCRMVVIDDLVFVGRQHQDAILTAIRKVNPVLPGPVDHLPNNFLALIVEFDAPDGSAQALQSYLEGLWRAMPRELTAIFQHCEGFDHASPANSFVKQVMQGQIETTMSFHDYYWKGEPGMWEGSPVLPNKLPRVLAPPLGAALIGVIAVCWLSPGGVVRLVLILTTLAIAIIWILRRIVRYGMEAFPPAPRSDLRSVLKALYLQRKFIDFMVANQGCNAQTLQANFTEFLRLHQPQSVDQPAQAPGCIAN